MFAPLSAGTLPGPKIGMNPSSVFSQVATGLVAGASATTPHRP